MKKLILLLFCLGLFSTANAQITIAPTMVFIDQQNRFGSFLVLNGSEQPQEVSIEFPFGYPVTNDRGSLQMVYDDSAMAQKFGVSDLVRGFPQNFVLQPGQRQVIRLTVRPKDFSDGTYWTRIKTTSNAQNPAVGEQTEEGITARINYKFEQVTTLFYRHGDTDTGINIKNFAVQDSNTALHFAADVNRTGNSPFLGSIMLTVKDENDNIVTEKKTSTSIYFDYRQVFTVEEDSLGSGTYEATITFKTQRPDIPAKKLIQMDPVSQSISFTNE
jgi:hypothetical protein